MNKHAPLPPREFLARPSARHRERMSRLFEHSTQSEQPARLARWWPLVLVPLGAAAAMLFLLRPTICTPPPHPPPTSIGVIIMSDASSEAFIPAIAAHGHYEISTTSF